MSGKEKSLKKSAIINYFEESYQELRKVSWPTRNQAVRLTFLVLGFCLVAAIVVGVFDFAFMTGSKELTNYANIVNPPPVTGTADTTGTPVQATATPVSVDATTATGTPITITPATPTTKTDTATKTTPQ